MKINKEMLSEITKGSDEELWGRIREIATRYGLKLPDGAPPKSEMARLRAALSGADKLSLVSAMEILNTYRRGKK